MSIEVYHDGQLRGTILILSLGLGRKFAVKHLWAYMVLGQLVAISVATNLFFLTLVITSQTKEQKKGTRSTSISPPFLWFSVLAALVTVGLSPYTTEKTFLPNLLVMHVLLVLPLLPFTYDICSQLSIRIKTLYILTALVSHVLRVHTTVIAYDSLPEDAQSVSGFLSSAWTVLHSHPAQSSIGWDVIWTTISVIVWFVLAPLSDSPAAPPATAKTSGRSGPFILGHSLITCVLSPGVGAPLLFREEVDEVDTSGVKDR